MGSALADAEAREYNASVMVANVELFFYCAALGPRSELEAALDFASTFGHWDEIREFSKLLREFDVG